MIGGLCLALAQAFVRGYLEHGADAPRLCKHLFTPDVVLVIHADDKNLGFAGEFHGIEGIERMIRNAYTQFTPVEEDFGRWSSAGQRVVAFRSDVLKPAGADGPIFRTWILHEYTIVKGRIARIDNYLDSLAWTKYIEHGGKAPEPGEPPPLTPPWAIPHVSN